LAPLRPFTERQGEAAHVVTRQHRVDRQFTARDLLLHECVLVLREIRMPERVVAQLESLLRQEAHLREAPLRLLSFDTLVAEERAAGFRRRQHAEDRTILPAGMRPCEL